MTWKDGPLNQHRWSGPHRVILQDEHHTVWSTSNGKLIRSAPENTRRSLPEEGRPEGTELPADITPMAQQIARMTRANHNDVPDIPTEGPLTPDNPDHNPSHNDPNNEPDNPPLDQSDSQDEWSQIKNPKM